MINHSCQPRFANQMMTDPVSRSRYDSSILAHDKSTELDHKGRTQAERQALFMTGFTNILQHEGLRSPGYYHDKSQCISFQDCSPAEMGIIKAERLKWGYVEPEELAYRLRQLKPSNNFTLRKYRHPKMSWDKTPIPKTPRVRDLPEADWFLDQEDSLFYLKKQLGDSLTQMYRDEAQRYWDKVCDIKLASVPDICFLRHINHSPSGTLFPRYLVKALWGLLESTHNRGLHCYYDKYDQAKRKREETIREWRKEHPGEVLADDAISIYRTWPIELMAFLDEIDREAIREGTRLYMADLEMTGQKMQELVTFWTSCGLITGARTPPSPQWPDPKAKLNAAHWPDYLFNRLNKLSSEFGSSGYTEGKKRKIIELARWKEAVLNTDCDPLVSEMPITQPLLQKLETILKGYESFIDQEFVEDEMIDVLGRWRRGEAEPCSGFSSPSETDSGKAMLCSRLSGSETRAVKGESQPLQELSSNTCNPRDFYNEPVMNDTAWLGRLRPRSHLHGACRRPLEPYQNAHNSSYHIVKVKGSKPSPKRSTRSSKGKARAIGEMAIVPRNYYSQCSLTVTPQITPPALLPRQKTARKSSKHIKIERTQSSLQGLQNGHKAPSKFPSKRRRSESDGGPDEGPNKVPRLLTPPASN